MSAHNKVLRLADLPNGALTHAASYLAPPSQALFALAMEGAVDHNKMGAILTQEQIWCMGRAISGTEVCRRTGRRFGDWKVLDFGTVEESLASRMTDALIEKILVRIDAFDKLRELRLAGCVEVVGSCFALLRGSRSLERIDISLAHYQKHGEALFTAHEELKASGCVQLLPLPAIQEISGGLYAALILAKGMGAVAFDPKKHVTTERISPPT